jgi:hypothetical protein
VAHLVELLAKIGLVGQEARRPELGVGGDLLDLLRQVIKLVLKLDGDLCRSDTCAPSLIVYARSSYAFIKKLNHYLCRIDTCIITMPPS